MKKKYKAVISVGVGRDKAGFPIPFGSALVYRNAAIAEASSIFGGVTVTENYGGWMDDSSELVTEESWDFAIVSDKKDKFREFSEFLKGLYNQSAVMLVVSEVEVEFI